MEQENEKTEGTRGLRWAWERLAKATTKEEVEQVLAEAATGERFHHLVEFGFPCCFS